MFFLSHHWFSCMSLHSKPLQQSTPHNSSSTAIFHSFMGRGFGQGLVGPFCSVWCWQVAYSAGSDGRSSQVLYDLVHTSRTQSLSCCRFLSSVSLLPFSTLAWASVQHSSYLPLVKAGVSRPLTLAPAGTVWFLLHAVDQGKARGLPRSKGRKDLMVAVCRN